MPESVVRKYFTLNTFVQIGLTVTTMAGFLLTALKLPHYGLILSLISEFFWVYSSYKAWKQAKQFGIFVTTILITIIVAFGVINYWFLGNSN